jgi:hypothetical protein
MSGERVRGLNDRAVSESIGFIIIMGIMLTGIAMVTLYGYPALVQEQQNTNIRNMERNMIVLQNDLKGLTYKNVPYQETMLQVGGGTMLIHPDGGLNAHFTVNIPGDGMYTYPTGGILYISQDQTTNICLENGAVHTRFWSYPEGSAMLAEPRWFYDNETKTFVMTFITMNATEYFAQTGIGTVRMRLVESNQTNWSFIPPVANPPIITYQPDPVYRYHTAWNNYFNKSELKMNSSGINTYTLDPSIKNLVIKTYNVTVLSL